MSFKTTYILFALLAGMIGVLGLTLYLGPQGSGDTDYAIPSLHDLRSPVAASDIDTVEIRRTQPKEETITFVRDHASNTWKMTQPHTLRVDRFLIDSLVRQVMDAQIYRNAQLNSKLEEWGLDSPSTVITLKKDGSREWKLNLGKERLGQTTGVVYATSSDRPAEPIAIKRTELESVFKKVNEYRAKDLLTESALNITHLSLKEPKKEGVVLDKVGEDRWRFVKPAYGEAAEEGETSSPGFDNTPERGPKPITGVRQLVKAIEDIRVPSDTDFVAEGVTDMAKYGLEKDPARMRIEIKSRGGNLLGGDKTQEPVENVLLVGKKADDKSDMIYARLENEDAVVKIPASSIEPLAKIVEKPDVLRSRDLARIDQAKIDAIDIRNAAGLIKLRKPQTTWKEFVDKGKGRSADDLAVTGLLSDLAKRRQVQFFPDAAKEADMGFDKPEAVVTLWAGAIDKNEKKDEKKEDKEDEKDSDKKDKKDETKDDDAEPKLKDVKPVVTLTFGKKDRDLVYVRREVEGDKALVEVPEALLGVVTQGPLAYQDKTLPSFSEAADVADVVLDRGGSVIEVKKDKDTWKFKQPKELLDRNADGRNVDRIIQELRGLRPDKLVAEAPSAAELEKFGLKAPRIKATVKVPAKGDDKKTEDWVYSFGNETETHTGVYARMDKRNLVVVVPSSVLDVLRSELRRTVLAFDLAKVKEVKLIGWRSVLGTAFTLDLDRKSAKEWVAKSPSDFDLDSAAAEAFVASLVDLEPGKVLTDKTKIEPKDQSLRVEITVEGTKEPMTLTIGALDPKEKAYAAQSSKLPAEVFQLPQAKFEKPLSGPKFFSKGAPAGK
jgi:hypothetical protein